MALHLECLTEFCHEEKEALKLEKAIYGLVQVARQFFKKIRDSLVQAGFKSSEADPCLVYKEDKIELCIMLIYIDDMLIVGTIEAIDQAIQNLQQSFEVKAPTTLKDFLGVQIVKSKNGEKAWLGQPTIIKSLEKMFDKMSRHCKVYEHQAHQVLWDKKLLRMKTRLLKRNKPSMDQEWEHCSITQNIPDQI